MSTLGIVTIGQAPRDDIVELFAAQAPAGTKVILRGALEARLGGLTLLGKLDYFESDGDGPSAQNRGIYDRNSYDLAIDNPGSYANEIWTGSLTATMDIGAGTLTNVFGYRDYKAATRGDWNTVWSSFDKRQKAKAANEGAVEAEAPGLFGAEAAE